jgi:Tfp pilus assembly protein PilP
MRVLPLLLIVSLSLIACVKEGSSVLPSVKEYSRAVQAQAADELEALPEGSVLPVLIGDYAVLREQLRAGRAQ